jgi:hemolysin activation/secretion protein
MKGIIATCFFSAAVCASEPTVFEEYSAQETVLEDLKGVIIKSPDTQIIKEDFSGVWIDPSLSLPGSRSSLEIEMQKYLGHTLTKGGLHDLRMEIARYYQDHHRPIVSVVVPPQDISDGVVQIEIVESKLGKITTKGNRWTSDRKLKNNAGVKKNEPLNSYDLQRNLSWLNRNPFRSTDAILTAGNEADTTDVELVTKDRIPFRPYIGADNTGVPETEKSRLYAGVNIGNIFGLDQQLSYQYTTSDNGKSFQGHSGSYLIPFSWRQELLIFGGYAKVKGHLPPPFKDRGEAWQISGRYRIPVNPIFGNTLQELSFGYDFKRTNNSIQFGGRTVIKSFADINQFLITYTLDLARKRSKTSFVFDLVGAPCRITKDQNKTTYGGIRPFAKPEYVYGRGRIAHTQYLPHGYVIKGMVAGQGTGWNLLPSEEFGLGGYDTVRGYNERAFNADNGVLASIEFMTCDINLLRNFKCRFRKEHFQFLAFVDYGWGMLHKAVQGEKRTDWLLGVGPGLRYQYNENVLLRADAGFPIHREGFGNAKVRFHLSGTLSY